MGGDAEVGVRGGDNEHRSSGGLFWMGVAGAVCTTRGALGPLWSRSSVM